MKHPGFTQRASAPPAVWRRLAVLMTNILDRSPIGDILRRGDVDAGAGEKVISSLAASSLAEGIAHPELVGACFPYGVLAELHLALLLQPMESN